MKDLYKRLKERGFDRTFIQQVVLPDWWEDRLGEIPANRALAEASIARSLKFSIADLRDPEKTLPRLTVDHLQFKKRKNADPVKLCPGVLVGQQVANLVAMSTRSLPSFQPDKSAAQIRAMILANNKYVDLENLIEFAWSQGIIVIRTKSLPSGSRFDGIAMYVDETPVIVLGSGRDSPPWLVFHLAHELGHVYRQHVSIGKDAVVDTNIAGVVIDDVQESEADEFGLEILTGDSDFNLKTVTGLTAKLLAKACVQTGDQKRIHPGTVALVYGNPDRIPVAQKALKELGFSTGAEMQIASQFLKRCDLEKIPESSQRFVEAVLFDEGTLGRLEDESSGAFDRA